MLEGRFRGDLRVDPFRYHLVMLTTLALLALAAWLFVRIFVGYPLPVGPTTVLRRNEGTLLASVSEAMFPPGGHIEASGLDAGLPDYVDRWMAVSSVRTRVLMHLLFFLIEHATLVFPAPGRGGRRRFSSLDFDQRVAVLEGWGESGLYLRRLVFVSLRSILTMGYFGHPPVLRRLDVAPFAIESPICEADLLYPPIGARSADVAYTSDDLTTARDVSPLLPGSPLHPDYVEETS
jgi:hypothetical protein